MPALTVADLTGANTAGTGVFDVLMRSVKAHLDQEFQAGRIRGAEYGTVYLGSLELAMQTGVAFLLAKDKNALEAQLLEKQIELATVQVEKEGIEVQKAQVELAILQAQQSKIPFEIEHLQAQTALVGQQTSNLAAEAANIPKQGNLLDAQAGLVTQQGANAVIEGENLVKQGEVLGVQKLHIIQQTANLAAESANIPKQGKVLDAQECKLKAEFDYTVSQTAKSAEEIALLAQKVATEKAQTQGLGVDADSVVGRQKALYVAQADGFKRDAEQKAAKLFADTWSMRRTTDTGTEANGTNMLSDAHVGRAMSKLLDGVGA